MKLKLNQLEKYMPSNRRRKMTTLKIKHRIEDLLANKCDPEVSGITLSIANQKKYNSWSEYVIQTVHNIFEDKANDVFVMWLKPSESDKKQLRLHMSSHNLKKSYQNVAFKQGEGAFGKAWQDQEAIKAQASEQKNSKLVSFICSPVGKNNLSNGLLIVGSESGFKATGSDMTLLSTLAHILAPESAT